MDTVAQSVRDCESYLFQVRVSVLPAERRDNVLHFLARMKGGWIEEVSDRLKCFQEFPLLCLGLVATRFRGPSRCPADGETLG